MIWTAVGAAVLGYQIIAIATGRTRVSRLWPWNLLGAIAFGLHFIDEARQ